MNRLRPLLLPCLALAAILDYCSCNSLQPIAGGTSETTNGFAAVVRDQNGSPVAHALVRMRPQSYLSDTSNSGVKYDRSSIVDTVTDLSGRFVIKSIDTGEYAIEIQDGKGGGALIRNKALKDSIVDCGIAVVRSVGSIQGIVDRTIVPANVKVCVRVYGLERLVRADTATGIFILSSLPQTGYTIRFVTSSPSYAAKVISTSVTSGSSHDIGKVILFPFNGWGHSKRIALNTTASGANVSGNVFAFPVLIRLTDSNFIFSQAKTIGEDLRFTKSDSTPLCYEIELWDAANGQAEIWVKVDTVYGNDNTHFISMYWGNPAAASVSNGAAVFDTANGFRGVWHLTDTVDATICADDPYSTNPPSSAAGIVGGSKSFNGTSQYLILTSNANLNCGSTLTFSAWIKWESGAAPAGSTWPVIIDRMSSTAGTDGWRLQLEQNNDTALSAQGSGSTALWPYPNCGSWSAGNWLHLVVVYNGATATVFGNGVVLRNGPIEAIVDPSRDFTIGKEWSSGNFWNGRMDEMRIDRVIRSADWIKLCYMNQKAQDALIEIK